MTDQSIDVMARTIWGEARGCGAPGMTAVACTIMNRVHNPRWWGHDVVSVCQAPYQFSCWLRSDPNRAKLIAVTEADPWFAIAKAIAAKAIAGQISDITNGADSYFALSMAAPPTWAERARVTYRDHWHQFCALEIAKPGTVTEQALYGDPATPNAAVMSHGIPAPVPGELPAPPPHEIAAELVETPSTEDLNSASLARAKQGT